MKKKWKIFWSVSVILLVIGVGLCAAGFALGAKWNMIDSAIPGWISLGEFEDEVLVSEERIDQTSSADVSVQSFSGIHSIEVEAEAMDLQVLVSDEAETVKVKIEDEDMNRYIKCYNESGELHLESDYKFNLNKDVATIRIYVPQDVMREVEVDVNAGTIYIEEIQANHISVKVDAGEAVVQKFAASEIELECGAGRIQANGTADREVEVTCGAGEVILNVTGNKEDYNYEIECGIGEVIIGNEVHSGINNTEKHSHHASKEMNIECGIGTISVAFQ